MNIQIFGSPKCFETKKAQRWFKERRIKFQYIDLPSKGLSPREYQSVKSKVGFENLVNTKCRAYGEPGPLPHAHRPQRQRGHGGIPPRGLGGLGINRGQAPRSMRGRLVTRP